jgi:hypothetical protein
MISGWPYMIGVGGLWCVSMLVRVTSKHFQTIHKALRGLISQDATLSTVISRKEFFSTKPLKLDLAEEFELEQFFNRTGFLGSLSCG